MDDRWMSGQMDKGRKEKKERKKKLKGGWVNGWRDETEPHPAPLRATVLDRCFSAS